MDKRVLIAMSGGVDSAVAALLIKEQGYRCEGVTLRMFDRAAVVAEGACGSSTDLADAAAVAERVGIPHRVLDFSPYFEQEVIRRFVETYRRGETPNPCVVCNRYIKFDRLFEAAKEMGYGFVATGHYARIEQAANGRYLLKRAVDPAKDQSYVLYALSQEQLAHTLFPLGSMTKRDARRLAAEHGFSNADKKDSQDICFVPDGDYAGFIERYTGKPLTPGHFVTEDGRDLGAHQGAERYTVGQRKGLGLALPAPLYVTRKCMGDGRVMLGTNEQLFKKQLTATDVNWIATDRPDAPIRVKAKVRYKQPEQWATVFPTGETAVRVEFDEPQRAFAAGQAVVFYDGDTVVGGGTIQNEP